MDHKHINITFKPFMLMHKNLKPLILLTTIANHFHGFSVPNVPNRQTPQNAAVISNFHIYSSVLCLQRHYYQQPLTVRTYCNFYSNWSQCTVSVSTANELLLCQPCTSAGQWHCLFHSDYCCPKHPKYESLCCCHYSGTSIQLLLWKRHVAANLVVLPYFPILEIPLALFYSNVGYKNYLRG